MEFIQSIHGSSYRDANIIEASACKLFLRGLDEPGIVIDSASTAIWQSNNLFYDSDLQTPYTNLVNTDNSQPLLSGSFNEIDGSKVLVGIVAGKAVTTSPGVGAADLRMAIGIADGAERHGIWFAPLPFHFLMHFAAANSGVNVNLVLGEGIDFFIVVIYQPGSGITTHKIYTMDGTELLSSANTGNLTMDSFTPEGYMRFSGMKLYGVAIYNLATLPSNWLLNAQWSANAWKSGHRYLFPSQEWL